MKTVKMIIGIVVAVSTIALAEAPRDVKSAKTDWAAAERNYTKALTSEMRACGTALLH